MSIVIIDYGMGNLRSVQKALEHVGANAIITSDPAQVKKADKVLLPGVGAIKPAVEKLSELNITDEIHAAVKEGKPFLGICVGFQLLFKSSTEGGDVKALGLVDGHVTRFQDLKVPQMGWNQLNIQDSNSKMFAGIDNGSNVYFCHSYFATSNDTSIIAAQTDYGVEYISAIEKDNLWGTQFHPEKSQKVGLKILENFNKL